MRAWTLGLLALATLTLAANQQIGIVLDGKTLPDRALVVDGRTYVPVTALKGLGVTATLRGSTLTLSRTATPQTTAPGGANQITALEGCVGQTFFNGVWRVRVASVAKIRIPDAGGPDIPGFAVNLEVRNGTSKSLSLMSAGFGADPFNRFVLVLPDGNNLKLDENDLLRVWSRELLPGGVMTFALRYAHARGVPYDTAPRPNKFVMNVDPKVPEYVGVKFPMSDPSLRVRLDCTR